MVAPTSHGSSRADPTRRAVMRIPTLVQKVFGSVTVWRSHSFTSLVSAHAAQVWHGDVRSPCHKRRLEAQGTTRSGASWGSAKPRDARAPEIPVCGLAKRGTHYASKGSGGNLDPHLAMPPRRLSRGTIHGCLRHGTTVATGLRLAHTSSPSLRQGPAKIA